MHLVKRQRSSAAPAQSWQGRDELNGSSANGRREAIKGATPPLIENPLVPAASRVLNRFGDSHARTLLTGETACPTYVANQ